MTQLLAIALGGALGALGRHYAAGWVTGALGGGFPWGIFAVNVLGSFLMGGLVEGFARLGAPFAEARAFLAVGVLGGFTTFSTFSLDAVLLIERGHIAQAAGYIVGSVVLAIGGLYFGMAVTRLALGGGAG
ncbi:MAG: fluoride efflux transporter CrcB [Marivibrio sp.]|uniref:fluoride efflux transporter CrcB n=1 Tax=Marivibrio sp. TaxID=2039719 RepID=UPI0032EC8BF3